MPTLGGEDLWAPHYPIHVCPCGGLVTADGSHGLSYGLGPGRYGRHAYLSDIISRSLTLAGVPNIKGISRTDGKRPDGLRAVRRPRRRQFVGAAADFC